MEYLPPPTVLKLLTGTQGVGVMRVRDLKEAGPIIDTLSELDQMICLQKYMPNQQGKAITFPTILNSFLQLDQRCLLAMKTVTRMMLK